MVTRYIGFPVRSQLVYYKVAAIWRKMRRIDEGCFAGLDRCGLPYNKRSGQRRRLRRRDEISGTLTAVEQDSTAADTQKNLLALQCFDRLEFPS
jgi:hypothetical protein